MRIHHLSMMLLIALATPLTGAEGDLFRFQAPATVPEVLATWGGPKAAKDAVRVFNEDGVAAVEVSTASPDNALLRAKISLPPTCRRVQLAYEVRVPEMTTGEKTWQVPRVVIQWNDQPEWKNQYIKHFPEPLKSWRKESVVIPVPAGATEAQIRFGTFYCSGTIQLRSLSLTAMP